MSGTRFILFCALAMGGMVLWFVLPLLALLPRVTP